MIYLLQIVAIFALTFAIKEIDGPFNLISLIRSFLMRQSIFFYHLFSCAFCVGFWSGIIVFLVYEPFTIQNLFLYGFFGAGASLLLMGTYNKLYS